MNKQNQSNDTLITLISFYKNLKGEYDREWSYKEIKRFIQEYEYINKKKKDIQLKLIEILESPFEEGLKKVREIKVPKVNGKVNGGIP